MVVVDVLNVIRRGWRPGAPQGYEILMGATRSLTAWLRPGSYCEVQYVGDPELLDIVHVSDQPSFEKLIEQGRLYLAPKGKKADLTVLALAKGTVGIVVADDEYREHYQFGHEWLLFDLKRAIRPTRFNGRWQWEWKDLEKRMRKYYGRPDDAGRVMSRDYIREIEAVSGFDFRDPDWPGVGKPVGFPHMARDLGEPVWWVRNRAYGLGIPDALSTSLTDEQVLRLRADAEGVQQAMPLPKAA